MERLEQLTVTTVDSERLATGTPGDYRASSRFPIPRTRGA